jgi:hypothetical protein
LIVALVLNRAAGLRNSAERVRELNRPREDHGAEAEPAAAGALVAITVTIEAGTNRRTPTIIGGIIATPPKR